MSAAGDDEGASCPTCNAFFRDYGKLLLHIDECSQDEFVRRCDGLKEMGFPIDDNIIALFAPFGSKISEGKHPHSSSGLARADVPEAVRDADAQEVIPGLFLGSISAARDEAFLSAAHVKSIINCAAEARPLPAAKREAAGVEHYYSASTLDDNDGVNFKPEIVKAAGHLDAAMKTYVDVEGAESEAKRGAVLVHCAAGVSRSATVLLTYLIKHRGMSLKEAAIATKRARSIIYPNSGFWKTLFDVESEAAAGEAKTEDSLFPRVALLLHRSNYHHKIPATKEAVIELARTI